MTTTIESSADTKERVNWVTSIPFLLVHLVALGAIFTGVTATAAIIFLVLFWGRMFFITGGYHRYFSHRSYKLGRISQAIMAFGGTTCAQKGPLWWAAHHRDHHRYSDTERDIHSPMKGFWWSHVVWILSDANNDTKSDNIKDFSKFPELRLIERFNWVGPWACAIAAWLIGGLPGLFFGFFCSTIALWHATFCVNSLAHVMGRRRYVTLDTSRNSVVVALLTMGEGWHNNHHYYQASARQGFFWWEFDPTFYILRALSWIGIVRDLKVPPERVLAAERIKEGHFDLGMFRAHWTKAAGALGAAQARAAEYAGAKKRALDEAVDSTRHAAETLATLAKGPVPAPAKD